MRKIDDSELIQMIKEGKLSQREMAEHFGCSQPAISKMKRKYKKWGLLKDPNEVPESFKNLTEKEQKFVIARLEGKNQTESALASFDCSTPESAKSIGSHLMQKNDIKIAISELMQDRGLTRTLRVDKLKEHIEHKDPGTSLKGIDIANRMEGLYGGDKHLHVYPVEDHGVITRNIKELIEIARERGLDTGKVIEADF